MMFLMIHMGIGKVWKLLLLKDIEPGASQDWLTSLGALGERIRDVFEKSPTLIVALYTVIFYSIITLMVLTVFILLNRRKMEKTQVLEDELNEKYQGLLVDYFFRKDIADKVEKELKRIANSEFNRGILINQIIDMSVNMQDKEKAQLKDLYIKLGLKEDSLKKVYSKKWHENIKGFRELAFMNIREANERIIKLLNSPNRILRMEAQIALVRLSDENPYKFLDFLDQPLSVWEQITIHELLIQHNLSAPDFSQWLKSSNLTIVRFSLQMIARFNQTAALPGVLSLLKHDDDTVRKEAIRTCGELGQKEALPVLSEIYYDEEHQNKEEVLK
ncbi:MAG TPA: HEAT repeat domain-containing protein, partial [Bacteroidales bacterium]|nr:HEAT repeat domain-containing protein [Bacteroidales bacterium]